MAVSNKNQVPAKERLLKGPFRVAIVEDDESIRKATEQVFGRTADFVVAAACADGESALRRIPCCAPDLVLMDIDLPGMSGIDCLRFLKAVLPQVRVVMVTAYGDDDRIFRSLLAGADGYLLKPLGGRELKEAARDILAGGASLSPAIARRMVDYFQAAKAAGLKAVAGMTPVPEVANLTTRQHEILGKLAQGVTVKEISSALDISWETVRNHITNIYDKLHVHSRTEAVLKYLGHPPADSADGLRG